MAGPATISLLSLVILIAILLVLAFELVLFLGNVGWYHAAGPTISRQAWQTTVEPAAAAGAIERVLQESKLVWRRWGDVFMVRKPWWHSSTYPRVTLRVESAGNAAAIVCEVKPYLSPMLFGLYAAAAQASIVESLSLFFWGLLAAIAAMYVYFWLWELPRVRGLPAIRQRLAGIGVRVCAKCGYDLYGLPRESSRCPECGADVETSVVPPR